MSRKRWLAVNITVIIVLLFLYTRLSESYFTAERAFYACERGLHYGPSSEILLKYRADSGITVIVGKYENGLSVIETKRKLLFGWGLAEGMITGLIIPDEGENMVCAYNSNAGRIMGLTNDDNSVKVRISFIEIKTGSKKESVELPVSENGFFFSDSVPKYGNDECFYFAESIDSLGRVIEKIE